MHSVLLNRFRPPPPRFDFPCADVHEHIADLSRKHKDAVGAAAAAAAAAKDAAAAAAAAVADLEARLEAAEAGIALMAEHVVDLNRKHRDAAGAAEHAAAAATKDAAATAAATVADLEADIALTTEPIAAVQLLTSDAAAAAAELERRRCSAAPAGDTDDAPQGGPPTTAHAAVAVVTAWAAATSMAETQSVLASAHAANAARLRLDVAMDAVHRQLVATSENDADPASKKASEDETVRTHAGPKKAADGGCGSLAAAVAARDAARAAYVAVCRATVEAAGRAGETMDKADAELSELLLALAAAAVVFPRDIANLVDPNMGVGVDADGEADGASVGDESPDDHACVTPQERKAGATLVASEAPVPVEAAVSAACTAVANWREAIARAEAAGTTALEDGLSAFFEACGVAANNRTTAPLIAELPSTSKALRARLLFEQERAVKDCAAFPTAAVTAAIVQQLRHHVGPFLTCFTALSCDPTRAVRRTLLSARVCWTLIWCALQSDVVTNSTPAGRREGRHRGATCSHRAGPGDQD